MDKIIDRIFPILPPGGLPIAPPGQLPPGVTPPPPPLQLPPNVASMFAPPQQPGQAQPAMPRESISVMRQHRLLEAARDMAALADTLDGL